MCLLHVIGLIRQRDKGYIGCVCVYVQVTWQTRQGNQCYIEFVCVYMLYDW